MSVATRPGPLNRVAVLFRLILALPVLILTNWVGAGVILVLVVLWFVVLVTGRMPGTPALALAALVRFQARTYGYVMLLATAYPTGLFGDREPQGLAPTDAPQVPDAAPVATRLYLPTAAKVLVALCIVLGIAQSFVNNSGTGFDTSAAGRAAETEHTSH